MISEYHAIVKVHALRPDAVGPDGGTGHSLCGLDPRWNRFSWAKTPEKVTCAHCKRKLAKWPGALDPPRLPVAPRADEWPGALSG